MALPVLIFNASRYARWNEPSRAIHFAASADGAVVTFLVSEEALAYYLNPASDQVLSKALSLAAFIEYESDLQRIARRRYKSTAASSRGPVHIRVEDVRGDQGGI